MIRAFIFLSLLFSMGRSDIIGGELNLGLFTHSLSLSSENEDKIIDVSKDFKIENKSDIFLRVYLEHPIPIIQNVRFGYTSFHHVVDGVAYKKLGETLMEFDVETEFNIDIYEMALYYEILDNWINLDAGINFRYVKGYMDVDYGVNSKKSDLDFPVPLLYAKFRVDIPITDLSFQFEGDFISYKEKSIYDLDLGLRYNFMLGFGVEAGYRAFKMKFDDEDNLGMDSNYYGVYGKVIWDF